MIYLARASVAIPLLRKEFIVDEYQILEAKAYGADLILLIAAVLTREEIKSLSEFAKGLGLY
jgi:indole-3-glycerol phosphate synthase